ncbi:MAG: hypothetical protein Fur002_07620 [Anaerolineales bacterium]
MTDLELLEMYEPTLRFAKSERFFPMAVEPYLEECLLLSDNAETVGERLAHEKTQAPLSTRMGALKNSEKYYLRFAHRVFDFSLVWRGLLGLFVVGLAVGGFFWGLTGVEVDLCFSFLVALFLFMLASPVRLRIIPAVIGVTALCLLSVYPFVFFLHPNGQNLARLYLIAFPLYLALFVAVLYIALRVTIEYVVPEGPGMMMDMFSRATEKVAEQAYLQYAKILKEHPQPIYYGRVLRETDEDGAAWTILQYHFFYAFNDWRLAANGFNHHEGDWEMIAVYLKNDSPYAVLMSQHRMGKIELWQDVLRVRDADGNLTPHPLIYVALGSHANYSRAQIVRSPSIYSGKLQRFLFWLDGVIHYLFLFFNPDQKIRQAVLDELKKNPERIFDEESFAEMEIPAARRKSLDRYVVRLPLEIASGDGFRVGPHAESLKEEETQSGKVLIRRKSRRPVTRPAQTAWRRILLNSEWDWVQYKGLWGVKSWLREESGPPGPRWERARRHHEALERIRWGSPLLWLKMLQG